MMTQVVLCGGLGKKFGREWNFDVHNVRQAIDALECARPGFRRAVRDMRKHVFRVKVGNRYCTPAGELLELPNVGRTIRITPILEGAANSKGIWQVIAGVVLVAVGAVVTYYGGGAVGTQLILGGVALIAGGVAQLLAPSPPGTAEDKTKSSYLFSSPINVQQQGGPVAIMEGELFIGSTVVSAAMEATDVVNGSDNTDPQNPPGGGGLPDSGSDILMYYDEQPTKFPH